MNTHSDEVEMNPLLLSLRAFHSALSACSAVNYLRIKVSSVVHKFDYVFAILTPMST